MSWSREHRVFMDWLYDIVGAMLHAVGVWCFIEPCKIAPGGASGIALLINHLSGLPVGTLTLLINVPLLIASYFLLNRKLTWRTIRTVVWITICLDYIAPLLLPQYVGDRLISSAVGGILVGAGMAMFFQRGSTSGGGDILAKLLQRAFPWMQTGYAIMVIDFIVIAGRGQFRWWENVILRNKCRIEDGKFFLPSGLVKLKVGLNLNVLGRRTSHTDLLVRPSRLGADRTAAVTAAKMLVGNLYDELSLPKIVIPDEVVSLCGVFNVLF
jgi:uncharacterized membrane protein YczE